MGYAVRASFTLKLKLESFDDDLEVVMFNSDWALNQIPRASCVLAQGRKAGNPSKAANIHSAGTFFDYMQKATVTLSAEGAMSVDDDWPEGDKVIFEGYVTGAGYQKVNGKTQFVVNLIHWLSDLDFSSTLSGQLHPASLTQYSFRAGYKLRQRTGVSQRTTMISTLAASTLISPGAVQSDLWGDAIKPFFTTLVNDDSIEYDGDLRLCVDLSSSPNTAAADALAKMEADPKLSLVGEGTLAARLGQSIASTITQASIQQYLGSTVWSTIVGSLAPNFLFSVVPGAEKAYVIPFIPGLRDTYEKEIVPEDFDFLHFHQLVPRPLRAVVIVGGKENRTNWGESVKLGIGGCYAPDDVKTGMVLTKAAPSWLANIPSEFSSPMRTSGLLSGVATPTSSTPVSTSSLRGGRDGKTRGEAALTSGILHSQYAQALYMMESLRGRAGNISGRLRFDIAPGASVKLRGNAEQFIGSDDNLGEQLFGTVLKVSCSLNAEKPAAGTGYEIGYIRTAKENASNNTSIDKHPLYTTKFLGKPLVEGYA